MKPSQRGDFHGALGNKQYTCVGTDVECERTGDSIGSAVKNLPVMQEPQQMRVQSLGREDPLEEGMAPTPVFLPGESHEQSSLVGSSPKGLHRVGHN